MFLVVSVVGGDPRGPSPPQDRPPEEVGREREHDQLLHGARTDPQVLVMLVHMVLGLVMVVLLVELGLLVELVLLVLLLLLLLLLSTAPGITRWWVSRWSPWWS